VKHLDSYWWKWTWHCAVGELVGIGVAGGIAAGLHYLIGEPASLLQKLGILAAMLAAGSLEGSLLGWLQWQVMKERLPHLPASEWIGWTVLGAVLGWLLGMTPSLFFTDTAGPDTNVALNQGWVVAVLILAMGLLFGGLFGFFQWLAFRKYAPRAARWILANALGWGLGLGWIFLGASLPEEKTPFPLIIFLAISGGLLAGLSLGGVTGLYLPPAPGGPAGDGLPPPPLLATTGGPGSYPANSLPCHFTPAGNSLPPLGYQFTLVTSWT
jgi:hypothetical protein